MSKEVDEAKLWEEYNKSKSLEIRNQLIELYAPLVRYLAGRLAISMPPNIETDDLIGYGVIGLIDAIDKYDTGRGVKFKTYASMRVRGAILDELRALDWVPRTVYQKSRKLEAAYLALENKLNRAPQDQEVADYLAVSIDDYYGMLSTVSGTTVLSVDSTFTAGSDDDEMSLLDAIEAPARNHPDRQLERLDMKRVLADGIKSLPEKEQQVIYLYYYEELTLKEIGKVLSVTESRISQLHTKSILRLKALLQKNIEVFATPLMQD